MIFNFFYRTNIFSHLDYPFTLYFYEGKLWDPYICIIYKLQLFGNFNLLFKILEIKKIKGLDCWMLNANCSLETDSNIEMGFSCHPSKLICLHLLFCYNRIRYSLRRILPY
jgi:hypothetical protein